MKNRKHVLVNLSIFITCLVCVCLIVFLIIGNRKKISSKSIDGKEINESLTPEIALKGKTKGEILSDPSLLVLFKTMDKEELFRYLGSTADIMQKLYQNFNSDPTSVICDASPEFRNIYVYTYNSVKTVFCYTDYNKMCIQFDTSEGESVWNGKIIYTTRADYRYFPSDIFLSDEAYEEWSARREEIASFLSGEELTAEKINAVLGIPDSTSGAGYSYRFYELTTHEDIHTDSGIIIQDVDSDVADIVSANFATKVLDLLDYMGFDGTKTVLHNVDESNCDISECDLSIGTVCYYFDGWLSVYYDCAGNYIYSYERKMISDNDIFYQRKNSGMVSKENGYFVDVNENYIELIFPQ